MVSAVDTLDRAKIKMPFTYPSCEILLNLCSWINQFCKHALKSSRDDVIKVWSEKQNVS